MKFRVGIAASVLRSGGVIAYPTEAVWGLGCDPWNQAAVQRILDLKGRSVDKGLILVAAEMSQFHWLLHDLPPQQKARLAQSWPGPITWLIPHKGRVPGWLCGSYDSIALRVSAHTVVRDLCLAAAMPLVSTSANPAGARPARQQFQVYRYFGSSLDYIAPGAPGGSLRTSSIRDLDSDRVLRH